MRQACAHNLMFLYYLDESYDNQKFAISAIRVPSDEWMAILQSIVAFRRHLRDTYGIFVKKEFHATDFVAGRGNIAKATIPKGLRAQIFKETLSFLATLNIEILNACVERSTVGDAHLFALERLFNRIQVNSVRAGQHFLLFLDEGKDGDVRKLARKMTAYNPITSHFGSWGGSLTKHVAMDRLIDDPVFRQSHQSYFIQLADFVAYSLLKSEVPPTESVKKYGLDKCFDILDPVLCKVAFKKDPRGKGIIRS